MARLRLMFTRYSPGSVAHYMCQGIVIERRFCISFAVLITRIQYASNLIDESLRPLTVLDSKLVARATRLVFAYIVSIVLLISAIVAGYVVLREEMAVQRALSEANNHINVIHRAINASVGLQQDYREAILSQNSNPRLGQVIKRRVARTIDELDERSVLLTDTMLSLQGTSHWIDFQWIYENVAANTDSLLDRYIGQMRELIEITQPSELQNIRPLIPAEAAGARHGILSSTFEEASEALVEIVTRLTDRIEAVHQRITFLILGMFFLVSLLIVLPLWQRLIREHKRHEKAHKRLHQLAYTDQVTGLPNLDGFEQNILPELIPAQSTGSHYLVLVRITNLDEIYNLIGNQKIVELHNLVCKRLNSSQIGGQNWSKSGEAEYSTVITQKIIDTSGEWIGLFYEQISKPTKFAGVLVRPLLKIAASQLEQPVTHSVGHLRQHQAMARMALSLFDRVSLELPIYTDTLTQELAGQNQLISNITQGIENREFVPFYQAKVDAADGRITSLEMLCRWIKADGKMVGPDKFIPAAEKSGQIVSMTYLLMEQVVTDVKNWFTRSMHIESVAINVSSEVLHHKDFIQQICLAREALLSVQSDLQIEITENVAIEDSSGVIRDILQQLSEQGIGIAIDDFGTGYASLQTLIDLPFDVLKIDRSFVHPMTEDGAGCEVVSAMISLSTKLQKRSVIEGVEYEWQWRQLTAMGADELQGFLFHKPSSADDFCQMFDSIQNWKKAG